MPEIIQQGGPVMWLLAMASASALFVFLERLIHYHRSQINSMEFLNGVRNVLKRDNIVEAISIPYGCLINNAGHGPIPLGNQILDVSLTPSLSIRDLSKHLE